MNCGARTLEILIKLGGHFTTDDGRIRITLLNDVQASLWQATYDGQCSPCLLRRDIAHWPDEPEFAHYRLTRDEVSAIRTRSHWLPLASMVEVVAFLEDHADCRPPEPMWPR